MVNITNYKRNENKNYKKLSFHTGQYVHHQKNLQTKNAEEGVEKREPPDTVSGNVTWYSHYREECGSSLKS